MDEVRSSRLCGMGPTSDHEKYQALTKFVTILCYLYLLYIFHILLQGLNTGVMLMNLEKMRSSKVYNSYFTHASLKTLFRKYNMTSLLGDQDFFTVLGAEHPDLFYILDCTFNRQMDSFEFSHSLFDKYHKCDEDINIYHGNGDSIIPSSNVDP